MLTIGENEEGQESVDNVKRRRKLGKEENMEEELRDGLGGVKGLTVEVGGRV